MPSIFGPAGDLFNIATARRGSWGTPELEITENIGKLFGAPTTSQGGSDLRRSTPTVQGTTNTDQSFLESLSFGQNPALNINTGNGGIPQENPQNKTTSTGGGGGGTTGGGGGTTGGGGGTTAPPTPEGNFLSDEQINQMFSGAFADLSNQEAGTRAQKDFMLGEAQRAGEEQSQILENRRTQGRQQLTDEEQTTRKQEASALSQARQLFNELNQYNLARFGSGTSAGQAAMELLGRSTQQGIGNVTQQAAENINKIKTAWKNLDDFVEQNKLKVAKDVESKRQEVINWFNSAIGQINANRQMLEGEKAQKRYEVLQGRTNFLNEIKRQEWEFGQQLESWKQSRQADLASQAKGYTIDPITGEIIMNMEQDMVTNAPREQGVVSTGPVLRTPSGVQVMGEDGRYGGSLRYQTLPTGEIVDKYTGQVVSPNQLPPGLTSM